MPAIPISLKGLMDALDARIGAYSTTTGYTLSHQTDVSKSATFPYIAAMFGRYQNWRTNNTWGFEIRGHFVCWTRFAKGQGDDTNAMVIASNLQEALTSSAVTGISDWAVIIQEPESGDPVYHEDRAYSYYGIAATYVFQLQYTGA